MIKIRNTNPSGYVHYDNEDELKIELENNFFPKFFDDNWKPILDITKEIPVDKQPETTPKYQKRIDYYGRRKNRDIFIEVKNWFITSKDIEQISEYYKKIEKQNKKFILIVICGGIDPDKFYGFLDKNIAVLLTKNIAEINSDEVVYWM